MRLQLSVRCSRCVPGAPGVGRVVPASVHLPAAVWCEQVALLLCKVRLWSSFAGVGARALRQQRQASLAARVEEALQYCEELDAAGSALARRSLLNGGVPRSRVGAMAAGSVHRRWYLHATGSEWDGSWSAWERALRLVRSDGALRDGATAARGRGRPRRRRAASPMRHACPIRTA